MKKLTLLALAAMTMAPATSFAESWTKEVTNSSEFKDAFNLIGSGMEGDTYEIVCNWDAGTLVNVGKLKPTMTKGKLVIRSNETDFDNMPQLQLAFEWSADAPSAEEGKRMSVFFSNLNLVGTGSYLIDNRRDLFADTISLTRCDIHGQARSILRFDGDKSETGLTGADMAIACIEVKECKIHQTAQSSGDNWSVFRTFMPVKAFNITDNMFYDMPYTKGLWETRNRTETATTVTFANNFVLLGENKVMHPQGFTVLGAAGNIGTGSSLNIYNNLFVGPSEGYTLLKDENSFYTDTKITNIEDGYVITNNNVIDNETYRSLTDLSTYLLNECRSAAMPLGGDMTLADFADFTWTTGGTFQDASKNMYYILNSNPWKTAGYDYKNNGGTYYIGPSIAYVDEFPTPASVNVNIDGPSYITYSISPEKDVYYVGDEITVTVDPQTSHYIDNLNTFEGWEDGTKELTRTFTLDGDLNLTAKFTENSEVLSAFTLKDITSNGKPESYSADVYLNMDPAYQSTVYAIVNDTTEATGSKEAPFTYVNGFFDSRPGKFGEDDAELQMPILSRRTWSGAKETQRNYALFVIPTKGIKDITFSCYVGTDNNAAKIQKLEFSTDSTTWTEVGRIEIENLVWGNLKATLPADANDKDKVYVRVIGDIAGGPVVTPDESIGMWNPETGEVIWDVYITQDAFEYMGSILITGDTSSVSDGIEEVTADEQQFDENAPMYNVMGMKVATGTKGLIIQNGKKFMVK